ncbi:hypothetical protein H1W37_10355 [Stappia taiwanensis]|uniref:Uncharacterized protein n=1 Tax=Stappia taiwanensis TaxID=992267 RepID=A0A838XU60_9HYPH|nr:hypothetical protein [Stappia taiwanensis]MBA4612056.1 hypothetical protein [Stappia taiwanensis]GGE91415.1 hypothetical protein GCM10007285_18820 [Stappia taiwanensis]
MYKPQNTLIIKFIKIILTFSLLIPTSTSHANQNNEYSTNWVDLFEICRKSIETKKSLDKFGLRKLGKRVTTFPPITHPILTDPIYPGYDIKEIIWEKQNSLYNIIEAHHPTSSGKTRRECKVLFKESYNEFTMKHETEFQNDFKKLRSRLVQGGSYEIWNPDPIFSTNLGFRSARLDENRCVLIFGLQIENRKDRPFLFRLYAGESDMCRK